MATRLKLKHRQLAAELAKSRMSQNRWADKLGLGRAHLSLLVNGRRPYPSEQTRRKLIEGLGVPFSTLFEVEDIPMPGGARPRHLAWLFGRHTFSTVLEGDAVTGLGHDTRHALRNLIRRPLFTTVVVGILALGIGANTALFGWMRVLVVEPLQVAEPERWVNLGIRRTGGFISSFSYPDFLDHRRLNDAFDDMFAIRVAPMSLSTGATSSRVIGAVVSASFFTMLDVAPLIGRTYTDQEDMVPGRDAVAVLSHGFWRRQFAGDPEIVGRDISINSHPFTVIGVMPEDFGLAKVEAAADLFVPLAMQEQARPGSGTLECRGCSFLAVTARLRAGYDLAAGSERAQTVHDQIAEAHPDSLAESELAITPTVDAYLGGQGPTQGVATALRVLMALMLAVLMICCANVAGLMLARAADREREIGIRQALGAGRARLLRQMLAESALLAVLAAVVGVAVAWLLNRLILRFLPALPVPVRLEVGLDLQVLAFTALVALLTGVAFGIFPALRASGLVVLEALRGGGPRVTSGGWARRGLVTLQIALSLVLLIGAGLFLRSLQNARGIDPGFAVEGLLVTALDPGLQGYSEEETRLFYRRLVESTSALRGVREAGLAEMIPLGRLGGTQQWGTEIEGYEPGPEERMNLDYNYVSPGYFATLGVPVVAGRDFTWEDGPDSGGVVIVNETVASRYWSGRSPLGRRLRSGGMWREVVGVVPDIKYYSLGEEPLPYLYFPFQQSNQSAMALHLRTEGDPGVLVESVRQRVRELDPALPLFDVRTMQQQLGTALLPSRLIAGILAGFGGLALVLAAVGLYGTIAYTVGQRTHELGIRMALGAGSPAILRLVLRQAAIATSIGLLLGLLGGMAIGRLAAGVLYGVDPLDAPAVGGAVLAITLVSALATLVPSRRATAIDPVDALRAD